MASLRRIATCAVVLFATPGPLIAADPADKDAQIAALQQRVAELEARVAKLEGSAAIAASADPNNARRTQQLAARERMKQDASKHSREELQAAEDLYQVANRNWRSPEARASLEQMIAKYPDVNRTGCAVLYLAQMAEGVDKQKLLDEAIARHGDCYYGDGVQVGAFGRFLLGLHYQETNQLDKAKLLFDELRQQYPQSVDHRGNLLVPQLSSN